MRMEDASGTDRVRCRENLCLSLPSPAKTWTRGSRRNQLRRGHGSPPVLSEVPYELSTDAHSKECKRSPQQFIPAGFPPHDTLQPGMEDSAIPLATPDMVRSGRVLHPQSKIHSVHNA